MSQEKVFKEELRLLGEEIVEESWSSAFVENSLLKIFSRAKLSISK
jgi:hypothetical protein